MYNCAYKNNGFLDLLVKMNDIYNLSDHPTTAITIILVLILLVLLLLVKKIKSKYSYRARSFHINCRSI